MNSRRGDVDWEVIGFLVAVVTIGIIAKDWSKAAEARAKADALQNIINNPELPMELKEKVIENYLELEGVTVELEEDVED